MGRLREKFSYTQSLVEEARAALNAGNTVFAPAIQNSFGNNGNRWGELVGEIEAVGWRLEHWSAGWGDVGATAFPLFRRHDPPPPVEAPSKG